MLRIHLLSKFPNKYGLHLENPLEDVKMGNCSECGKKLRFWDGYRHPILGKKYLLCSNCYDLIDKSLEFYNKCLFEGRENHKKECYF